jgi:SPP1 family predicted phage head-tail adaptor
MRFNSVIFLIQVISGENDMGDTIETNSSRQVFAEKKSIRQSEFYQAASVGLKPELTFTIWWKEYKGEQKLEFEGKEYIITRTFEKDNKEIELVCTGLVNGVM